MKNILVCCVVYKNEIEVAAYVNQLNKQVNISKIKVSININKLSGTLSEFKEMLKNAKVEWYLNDKEENLGYLNGCLNAYSYYKKNVSNDIDWVVVSNTDIEITDQSFFDKFINSKYKDIYGCIAPSVYSPSTKTYQNPHYVKRITLKKLNQIEKVFSNSVSAIFYEYLSRNKTIFLKKEKKESQIVYSPHGCFFVISNIFAEKLYSSNFTPLMYSEESHIAEILQEENLKCFYDSEIEILHHENTTTNLLGIKKRALYIKESISFIKERYYQ